MDVLDVLPIMPGARVAWNYEPCDPESGPSGRLSIMEGTVILSGELMGGRGFWVAADDGSRLLVVQRSWLLDPPRCLGLDCSCSEEECPVRAAEEAELDYPGY